MTGALFVIGNASVEPIYDLRTNILNVRTVQKWADAGFFGDLLLPPALFEMKGNVIVTFITPDSNILNTQYNGL